MNSDPDRLAECFDRANAVPAGAEREQVLAAACGTDAKLRAQVEELLRAHESAGDFLKVGAGVSPEMEAEFARLKPEEAGERIGHYKLLEQIGQGGFGTVWVAEQERPVRRRVALKIIKMGMDTREVIGRFEQERQALAMMEHPNIAKVLDAGATETGRPYFVMELVRGVKITEYCDQANLSTTERLQLFIAVCQAVQHAHQKGIIHRDLKPSNILVTLHDGVAVPKVIDFGVAKAIQRQRLTDLTVYTQFEQMVGTPLYMSPEQAEMSGLDIDTRADIYSLGVLLYELLTGRTPFDPEELMRQGLDEIRRTIREQEPQTPSMFVRTMALELRTSVAHHRHVDSAKLIGQISGDLDWIVMKALEKDRRRRYEGADAFAKDIERHLANEPVLARRATATYRFRRLLKRNALAFTAGTAVAAALLIGASISIWQGLRAQRGEASANAMLAELRATAPAFAAQARSLINKSQFADATEKLNIAIKLRPDVAEYFLVKGDILESQLRFAEAAQAYRAALRLNAGDDRARRHVILCEEFASEMAAKSKLSIGSIATLMSAMVAESRSPAEMMPIAKVGEADAKLARDYWLQRLSHLPIPPGFQIETRLTIGEEGLKLDLTGVQLADLSVLEGMPVHDLRVTSHKVTDLRPLSQLPLKSLFLNTAATDLTPLSEIRSLQKLYLSSRYIKDLSGLRGRSLQTLMLKGTMVSDLTPLRGMLIKNLVLAESPINDLTPLGEMQLLTLECSSIPATDYSPLTKTPLVFLRLRFCENPDLSFLRGMKLQTLSIEGFGQLRQFASLAELKNLESLTLSDDFVSLPLAELTAIESLRTHPTLRFIEGGIEGQKASSKFADIRYTPPQPKEVFWTAWDRNFPWIRRLHLSGVKFKLRPSQDIPPAGSTAVQLWELVVTDQSFSDLAILNGADIARLILDHTAVSDLTPLAGMPLTSLSLAGTRVTDLSPLAGVSLRSLSIRETSVSDLNVLRSSRLGASLEELYLARSKVADSSPVAECSALKIFDASETALQDLKGLRGLKLTRLYVDHTRVSELAPLAGMPLELIRLDATDATDLTPLLQCPTLEQIVLPKGARDIEALRALPRLRKLSFVGNADGEPSESAADFWMSLRN